MADPASLTGQYLSGRRSIPVPEVRTRPKKKNEIRIRGARGNNLKDLDVAIPLSLMTCVTGVSGSGKSTLINDTLYLAAAEHINRSATNPAAHKAIEGIGQGRSGDRHKPEPDRPDAALQPGHLQRSVHADP